MGSSARLGVGDLELHIMRSSVDPNVLALFSPGDRQESREPYEEQDKADGEPDYEERYFYSATVGVLCERLDVIGYTEWRAQAEFEKRRLENQSLDDDDFGYDYRLLPVTDFELWQRHIHYAVRVGLNQWNIKSQLNSEHRPTGHLLEWDEENFPKLVRLFEDEEYFSGLRLGFPVEDCDLLLWLRAVFSGLDKSWLVELDYSELIASGYYENKDLFAGHQVSASYQVALKTILLTEGSSDRNLLSRALESRFGHLASLYQFLDFHGGVSGGATELVKLVRALAGCGAVGRFIALFDADTAAAEALKSLDLSAIPANIKVMQLPVIELAEKYPTIGPQGDNVIMDVNGMACSVEMYLGRTALERQGELVKVQWSGYSKKLNRYQGELLAKGQVADRFLDALQRNPETVDWSGIDLIFHHIFNVFNEHG